MTKTEKDPFIKISKRQNLALKFKVLLIVGAIFLSLVLGGILLACLGYNPINFYVQMLMGNFKNAAYLTLLIQALIPLLITSLGISLAFKMRFWNIGAEGQFIVGAICAMTFALLIKDSFPSPLGTIIIVLAGAVGGGIYAVIVALLKVKFNTNETLMTLMLNYVAVYFGSYMLKTDFYANQGVGVPTFKTIAKALWLTEIDIGKFTFDTSLFIAVALVIIMFFYFKHSKQGYELNVVGDSPNTAKYAGMKVKWIIVRTMLLSGALIGLAGALKVCGSGAGHTFSANGDVGWTAIIVAWLAKLNPIGIFIASLLMSILERGCSFARTQLGISSAMSDVLQGIILFSVLASDFFINYKVTFRKKARATADGGSADTTAQTTDDDGQNAQRDVQSLYKNVYVPTEAVADKTDDAFVALTATQNDSTEESEPLSPKQADNTPSPGQNDITNAGEATFTETSETKDIPDNAETNQETTTEPTEKKSANINAGSTTGTKTSATNKAAAKKASSTTNGKPSATRSKTPATTKKQTTCANKSKKTTKGGADNE